MCREGVLINTGVCPYIILLRDGKGVQQTVMSDRREIQKTSGTSVEEAKPRLKKPRMFRVLLVNDDYTPMEFVVMVLQRIFKLPHEQAVQVMLKVHTEGAGVCGVFTAEVAETRVREVLGLARENEHPLQCTMEPE